MSSQSLTAKYRPQRFSEVAGQDAIKRILSMASAQDKVAPAYLFSGTRGVGKTTLARVMAKALNCLTAPTAEPCNECSQCRQITAGISPDVVEIDAATHGNVEEARRLKEDIGYAPMQSRYKVFIIDEAHMLSKAAFNALLKTLEEPPGRVTFILATTEPHKILPTIISRCQHYVFKRLTQPELEAHLNGLLAREGLEYEPSAVSLIARRGAGSVRDSMSLLAQVLAMGGASLREQDVRDVLGLAGQDVFLSLMQAFKDQDCLTVSSLLRQVLDRGLDIGFFLRELASSWRNMFLLNQAGEKALSALELTQEEGGQWLEWARGFDARHIHACWQMTLEGQRRVMTSLEPALALELLLLNLAYVPRLISLEALGNGPAGGGGAGYGPGAGGPGSGGPGSGGPGSGGVRPGPYGAGQRPGPAAAPPRAPQYAPPGVAPGASQYSAPSAPNNAPQAPAYAPPASGPSAAPFAPPPVSPPTSPARAPQSAPQPAPAQQGDSPRQDPPWDTTPRAQGRADGQPAGQAAAQESGQPSGQASAPAYGQPSGHAAAPATGQTPGQAAASAYGQAPGEASASASGKPSGQAAASAYGQAPGQSSASVSGQPSGQAAGPAFGQAPGQSPAPAYGQPGPQLDPQSAPSAAQDVAQPQPQPQSGFDAGHGSGHAALAHQRPGVHVPRTWKGFQDHAAHALKDAPLLRTALTQATGSLDAGERGDVLRIRCKNPYMLSQLTEKTENTTRLRALAQECFGPDVGLEFDVERTAKRRTQQELRAQVEEAPLFKEAKDTLGAYIIDIQHKS